MNRDRHISMSDIQRLKDLGYSVDRIGRMTVGESDHIIYLGVRATEEGE